MITPVELFIVATPTVPEVHVPPAFPLLVNVVVPFEHTACVPLNVPAFGAVVIVICLALDAHVAVPHVGLPPGVTKHAYVVLEEIAEGGV